MTLKTKSCSLWYHEAEINANQNGVSDLKMIIISNSWNMMTHIGLLISQLPDIAQKSFCTPGGAMDPAISQPFQVEFWWYIEQSQSSQLIQSI